MRRFTDLRLSTSRELSSAVRAAKHRLTLSGSVPEIVLGGAEKFYFSAVRIFFFVSVQRLNKAVVSLVRTRLSVGQSRNFFDSLSTQSSDRSRNKSNRNKLVSCRKSVDQLERENLEAFSRDSLDRQQRAGCSWRLEVRDKDRRVSWCTFGLYMQLLSDLRMTTAMEVKNTSNFDLCLTVYCVAQWIWMSVQSTW